MQNYVVGIDIGGTMVKGGLFTNDGILVQKLSAETQVHQGSDTVLKNLSTLVTSLQKYGGRVLSVGIGVAGVLDVKRETLLQSPNLPELDNFPLKRRLAEAWGIPVFVENDANAAALGEKWAGAGRNLDNFLLITLGTGIGGGFIVNGELWTGEAGKAGEVGHMVVVTDGVPCACGKYGCLEAHSSAEAVKRMAIEALQAGVCSSLKNLSGGDYAAIDAEMVYHAAKKGDAAATEIFKKASHYLAVAIANVNNLLDIHNFIIGGGMSNAFDLFAPFLQGEVKELVFTTARDKVTIVSSKLGNDAGIFGAGYLALKGLK